MDELHSRGFLVTYGATKAVAMLVGAVLTILTLMSVVGLVTGILWVHLAVAVPIALVPPFLIANRLLPDDVDAAKGVTTDVLAVFWGVGALAGVGLAPVLLAREADRFAAAGLGAVAGIVRFLAGMA